MVEYIREVEKIIYNYHKQRQPTVNPFDEIL